MKHFFIFFIFSGLSLFGKPKVYDCFLFLNELEILDIRLHEMNDYVDKFVLLESIETFRGEPKPLIFAQNAARFAEFSDKIIHIVYDQRIHTSDAWRREISQRNSLLKGLLHCEKDDIVMISDVDEIVNKEGIAAIIDAISTGKHKIVGANQRFHTVFLNSAAPTFWRGTVAAKYSLVKKYTPQGLREMRNGVPAVAGGWHFTWMGGLEQVLYKMRSYSHAESDTFHDRERTKEDYRTQEKFPMAVPLDDTFPQYLIENQKYLESIGYIVPPLEIGDPS